MRIAPAIYLSFACAIAQVQPSTAADLSKDVQALQRTVGMLQKQLEQEKGKNANIQQIERRFEKRVAELEKAGGLFGKSQIPLENRVKALQTQLNQLATRLLELEQAAGGSSGSDSAASLSSLDNRLDALESKIQISGSTLRLTATTIDLAATSQVKASGSSATMSFGTATFSGVLKSNSLVTDSVISKSYTPGAGNVW